MSWIQKKGFILEKEPADLTGVLETMTEDEILRSEKKREAPESRLIRKTTIDEITGQPCEVLTLLYISQHLDSLTKETISLFLSTFSEECNNNAEFSQWSNELLFEVIKADVNLYMKTLNNGNPSNLGTILKELSNPIIEFDLQEIYDLIKSSKAPTELIQKHLNSINSAAEFEGTKLKTSTNNGEHP